MSDNDFEDDHVDFDDPVGDEEFQGGGGTTLGDMWRNNPLVKIGVIAGGLITIIAAVVLFGGSNQGDNSSSVSGPGESTEAPGGVVSQAYKEAVEEQNVERIETAMREGTSAIPTPVDTPVTRLSLPDDEEVVEDPLERWRRIQEERQRQTEQVQPEEQTQNPHAETINALAEAMAAQMGSVLESKVPIEIVHYEVTEKAWLEDEMAKEAEKYDSQESESGILDEEEIVNILIPAGTIEYGQMILEANSDIEDSPVLAHLVSGPLAGSRLLGTFEREDEYLFIRFNSIVIDGIVHGTSAVALNPDTTLPALATDVDHRYFKRVVLPAAAAFVEGMGEAISETNSTTVSVDGGAAVSNEEELDSREELFKALEKSSEKIGEFLDEEADETEILVRVEAGTPMGLLFIEPVTDETG